MDEVAIGDVVEFVRIRKNTAPYLFEIWVRCIEGDKQNLVHRGWQAHYPRERKLFQRIINLSNMWMLTQGCHEIPSFAEFQQFIIQEADGNQTPDAQHIDQRCLRGNPRSRDKRGSYPRDRGLLKRILDLLDAFWFASKVRVTPSMPRE